MSILVVIVRERVCVCECIVCKHRRLKHCVQVFCLIQVVNVIAATVLHFRVKTQLHKLMKDKSCA